ncbi:hypothetical protein GPECTOR_9g433 [Gonium pectorale]|uniref:Uncharacterized protein n=1 Tax=Gonium pectorale TaxID=33097 RepID=A0A150GRC6_GONPE|nr:hypothetical protein GPECTOR_9g433 [Gonium pectorale]|eukprot:KXZ52389.1 hypothetical protein GPECTOR_9g433 [Gonium pectorale]
MALLVGRQAQIGSASSKRTQLQRLCPVPTPERWGHGQQRGAGCCRASRVSSDESALAAAFEASFLEAQQEQLQLAGQRQRGAAKQAQYDAALEEEDERERVFLVGAALKGGPGEGRSRHAYDVHESVEELGRLAETAGLRDMGPGGLLHTAFDENALAH